MRVCGRCEATIRLTAKFCGKCGFQQRKDTLERETPYIKPSDREQVEELGLLESLFLALTTPTDTTTKDGITDEDLARQRDRKTRWILVLENISTHWLFC